MENGWQRRGVRNALAVALVRRARERRSPFLRADVQAENSFALKALAGFGPLRTSWAQGSYTALIDLGLGTALVGTPSPTTPSDVRPAQSVHEAVGLAATSSSPETLR